MFLLLDDLLMNNHGLQDKKIKKIKIKKKLKKRKKRRRRRSF
jgi:hypothetical protein